jgi:hypothetical protein
MARSRIWKPKTKRTWPNRVEGNEKKPAFKLRNPGWPWKHETESPATDIVKPATEAEKTPEDYQHTTPETRPGGRVVVRGFVVSPEEDEVLREFCKTLDTSFSAWVRGAVFASMYHRVQRTEPEADPALREKAQRKRRRFSRRTYAAFKSRYVHDVQSRRAAARASCERWKARKRKTDKSPRPKGRKRTRDEGEDKDGQT